MLKIEGLCAGYGGVEVLHRISLEVDKGERLCIIGPNGCGKSTLLRAVAGMIPSTGLLEIEGRPVRAMGRRELAAKVAMLSQISGGAFSYSVRQTVMMGRYVHGRGMLARPSANDRKAVEESLASLGLTEVAEKDIGTLSGGQLQRVYLARVLAQEPRMILLDEPTNHLDFRYGVELVDYLKKWSGREHRGVIGVLHDINLALSLADRLLVLSEGRAVACGPPREVLTRALLKEVYGMDVAGYMRETLGIWGELEP